MQLPDDPGDLHSLEASDAGEVQLFVPIRPRHKSSLFQCTDASCTVTFGTDAALQEHFAMGVHTRDNLECETIMDRAKVMYASKLNVGGSMPNTHPQHDSQEVVSAINVAPTLLRGWGLKKDRKSKRFSVKQSII